MKNKEIVSIGNHRFFTVNYDKKVVSYTQNYKGVHIVRRAMSVDNDTFDSEFGKALSYAKVDLEIREYELDELLRTCEALSSMRMNEYGNRFERKYYRALEEEIKKHRRYYKNQKRLVEELQRNDPGVCTTYTEETCGDWTEIIKKAIKKTRKI